jgi:hypothetical protein
MTKFALTSNYGSTIFDTREEAVADLLSMKYAREIFYVSRQDELDCFGNDPEQFVEAHGQRAWDNDNNQYNWLVTGVDGISECGWYADEDQAKTALEDAAIRAIWFAKTESIRIEKVIVSVCVNSANLDQALYDCTEDELDQFANLAADYATKAGMPCHIVQDGKLPAFFFSIDDGATVCNELDWECNQAFTTVCERLTIISD